MMIMEFSADTELDVFYTMVRKNFSLLPGFFSVLEDGAYRAGAAEDKAPGTEGGKAYMLTIRALYFIAKYGIYMMP